MIKKNKCYWITGLPSAGKTTIAKKLFHFLKIKNRKVVLLDAEHLRKVFGFDKYDNKNRLKFGLAYARLCKYLINQDCDVIIGIVGLFNQLHEWNRKNIKGYVEIFLDVPIQELKKRDPKGFYKLSSQGKLKNFPGLDLKVDFPKNPNLHLLWSQGENVSKTFDKLIKGLKFKAQ